MTRPGIEPGSPEDRCQQNRFCQEKDSYYRPIMQKPVCGFLFTLLLTTQFFPQ